MSQLVFAPVLMNYNNFDAHGHFLKKQCRIKHALMNYSLYNLHYSTSKPILTELHVQVIGLIRCLRYLTFRGCFILKNIKFLTVPVLFLSFMADLNFNSSLNAGDLLHLKNEIIRNI